MTDNHEARAVKGQADVQAVAEDEETAAPNTALSRQVAVRLLEEEFITEHDRDAVAALLQNGKARPEDWVRLIERTTFIRETEARRCQGE